MPPGTAKTSLPCSKAHLAVMSDPLDWVPSTTSTPRLSPAMSRLRTGKWAPLGGVPGGYSLTSAPWAAPSS